MTLERWGWWGVELSSQEPGALVGSRGGGEDWLTWLGLI